MIALCLGIFFRFYNLNGKVYWWDEMATSLAIFGYTSQEVREEIATGKALRIGELNKYYKPNPKKTLADTFKASRDYPHLPPLYYVIGRYWVPWFSEPLMAIRGLSAVISVFGLLFIYFLCRELFQSSRAGWLGAALLAVSPFHILYAQEARFYSLWTAAIMLSGFALLCALRRNTKLLWLFYAATVSLGLYSHLFFIFVMIGFCVSVVTTEISQKGEKIKRFIISSTGGFLTFIPQLLVTILSAPNRSFPWMFVGIGWATVKEPLGHLAQRWFFNVSSLFIDVYWMIPSFSGSLLPEWGWARKMAFVVSTLVLIFIIYSLFFLIFKAPKKICLFILPLVGITVPTLILIDLVFDGRGSSAARLWVPSLLGIQLMVAYCLAALCNSSSFFRRRMGQTVILLLMMWGTLTSLVNSQLRISWNKYGGVLTGNWALAQIFNKSSHPIIVSDTRGVQGFLAFARHLQPETKFVLVGESRALEITNDFGDIFLFHPSNRLIKEVEELGYLIEPLIQSNLGIVSFKAIKMFEKQDS